VLCIAGFVVALFLNALLDRAPLHYSWYQVLSNLLSVPTEILICGIFGPNRLSLQWLTNATVSVRRELDVVSELIEAL
jgi:hypothetical protein